MIWWVGIKPREEKKDEKKEKKKEEKEEKAWIAYHASFYLPYNKPDCFEYGMLRATEKNNIEIVKYFVCKGANNFEECLKIAIKKDNKELIDFFQRKIPNWRN